jgi:hypothetical protein
MDESNSTVVSPGPSRSASHSKPGLIDSPPAP